jgi:hypothetical protein
MSQNRDLVGPYNPKKKIMKEKRGGHEDGKT